MHKWKSVHPRRWNHQQGEEISHKMWGSKEGKWKTFQTSHQTRPSNLTILGDFPKSQEQKHQRVVFKRGRLKSDVVLFSKEGMYLSVVRHGEVPRYLGSWRKNFLCIEINLNNAVRPFLKNINLQMSITNNIDNQVLLGNRFLPWGIANTSRIYPQKINMDVDKSLAWLEVRVPKRKVHEFDLPGKKRGEGARGN